MKITEKMHSSLLEERGQTDTSLVTERGKTDNSFADHRKQTESETDRRVKSDRQGADDVRAQNRLNADATTDLGRSGRTKTQKNRTETEISQDNSLIAQRERDDAAVDSERNLMDEALVHERGLNDVESIKFLDRERKETDKSLQRERVHTDQEYLVSKNRLNIEQTSHLATKAALTSRDEFLAIVSHDLRNPIGAILSYAELLLEEKDLSSDDVKCWTQVIRRNAKTSLRLINDILDMERFAEGKLVLKFAPRDINTLVRESVESLVHVALERKINVTVGVREEGPLSNCDRDRIGQVLANLIGNAIKFTPEGGAVCVTTKFKNNEFQVLVTDTGPGIPDNKREKIFGRYTQLGNKDREGLGLGLFISAMLVEAHGGKIGVANSSENGSTFCFTVPIN